MRSIQHWTPRYLKDRLAEAYYHRTHPGHPWLTRWANEMLASYLRSSDVGVEFGSGRSTLWFARRVAHLTSVEHDEAWYGKVTAMLRGDSVSNVTYCHAPLDKEEQHGADSAYVRTIDELDTESVDFVLVDGAYRDFCARESLRVIRPGGLLIIDNVNWFLPSESVSPDSRSADQGPSGPIWQEVSTSIGAWRSIWTTSGVTDTAFYFKPHGREAAPTESVPRRRVA